MVPAISMLSPHQLRTCMWFASCYTGQYSLANTIRNRHKPLYPNMAEVRRRKQYSHGGAPLHKPPLSLPHAPPSQREEGARVRGDDPLQREMYYRHTNQHPSALQQHQPQQHSYLPAHIIHAQQLNNNPSFRHEPLSPCAPTPPPYPCKPDMRQVGFSQQGREGTRSRGGRGGGGTTGSGQRKVQYDEIDSDSQDSYDEADRQHSDRSSIDSNSEEEEESEYSSRGEEDDLEDLIEHTNRLLYRSPRTSPTRKHSSSNRSSGGGGVSATYFPGTRPSCEPCLLPSSQRIVPSFPAPRSPSSHNRRSSSRASSRSRRERHREEDESEGSPLRGRNNKWHAQAYFPPAVSSSSSSNRRSRSRSGRSVDENVLDGGSRRAEKNRWEFAALVRNGREKKANEKRRVETVRLAEQTEEQLLKLQEEQAAQLVSSLQEEDQCVLAV